jgi:hypothetical protein
MHHHAVVPRLPADRVNGAKTWSALRPVSMPRLRCLEHAAHDDESEVRR